MRESKKILRIANICFDDYGAEKMKRINKIYFYKALNYRISKLLGNKNMSPDRIKSLNFHVESQDYFGTLATVLSLCRADNQPIPESIINDLIYLQKNYKIVAPGNDGKNGKYVKTK
jgi:hypothetical protein